MQEHFNQYYLTEQLASKPLRSVYLAHRVNDASQKVVVKLFDATCLNPEQESKSLLQKVEWTKQFKHAHIVPVLDLGIEQGQPYVVSKYLSSGSLRHRLNRLSPQRLDLQEALRIICQVGQALCYAHAHNILHSNIKPENIFFNKQGKVLLTDFRFANFINVTKLNYKSDPHTTCYMAPEQFSGTSSEKSDQYALACLAYELITGRAPFSAQGFFSMWAKQSTQYATPLCELVPNLPEPIEEIVLKAMAKDPSERYADVSTFLSDLETSSLSPISTSTRTPIASPNKTLTTRGTEPLKALRNDSALVTRLSKTSPATRMVDRPEHANHGISKTLEHSTESLDARDTDIALVTRLSKTSPATRVLDRPGHANHGISKTLEHSTEPLDARNTDLALVTRLSKTSPAARVLDRPGHANHGISKTLEHSTEPLDARNTDLALVTRLSKTSPAARVLDRPEHANQGSSKTLEHSTEPLDARNTDLALVTRLSKTSPAARVLDRPEHANQGSSKTIEHSTEPLDARNTDPALVTRLSKTSPATHVLDSPEHANHSSSKTLEHSTEPLDARNTDPALVTRLSKTSPATHVLDRPEHANHGSSKTFNTQSGKTLETSSREAHSEPLPIGRLSQPGKPVTPTLWLAFALSSIALLMGTVMLYAIVPLRSSISSEPPIKSRPTTIIFPTHQAIYVTPTTQPPIQKQQAIPPVQPKKQTLANQPSAAPIPAAPAVQTSLTSNYTQQNQAYNLTNEGTLDWINWGLNTPQDVNHKANVQQQISNFTVIGDCTVQRNSYYSNSNIEWFDGIPQPDTASSQTWGVYVTGINNGFRITVPASTTPRTLRVYVGAKLAQGKFTASLDDKTYTDATLDMTHDPNGTQANGIYTVVFNGNAANQALSLTYTAMATNGSNSYVMLQAATLQ